MKKRLCARWLECRILHSVVTHERMAAQGFHTSEAARYWCPHYGVHDPCPSYSADGRQIHLSECDTEGGHKCIFHGPVCIEVDIQESSNGQDTGP